MKRLLIIGLATLMIGCQSTNEKGLIDDKVSILESELATLKTDKAALMDQIKTISSEKMVYDEENNTLKEKVAIYEKDNAALLADNDALTKSLETIEVNAYEAQYNFDVHLIQASDSELRYVFKTGSIPHAQYYIVIGDKLELDTINEAEFETLDLGDNAYEVTSFQIVGSIYNFKWAEIKWNEAFTEYTVSDAIETFNKVTDKRVNIHTTLPEGLPNQIVIWENSQGKVFKKLLSYDGYGFEGSIILSK